MYHKIHWYANILLYQVYARNALKSAKHKLNIYNIMKLNYSIVTRVENTPFTIIQDHDGKFAITIANNIVCKPQETEYHCMKLIERRDWELISNTICALMHIVQTVDEYETKNEESADGNS